MPLRISGTNLCGICYGSAVIHWIDLVAKLLEAHEVAATAYCICLRARYNCVLY